MWQHTDWRKAIKIGISIGISFIVIGALATPPKEIDNTDSSKQSSTKEEETPANMAASVYQYEWNEETDNTYWIFIKDFDNTASDFKDRAKATIKDFATKVAFTDGTLVSLTDNADVFRCETLAGKPSYTVDKYIECLNEAGGKEAYNAARSSHDIALYRHNFKYNEDASNCKKQCNQLIFYPDASSSSELSPYKETLFWKP
jgi:hypothetical protein